MLMATLLAGLAGGLSALEGQLHVAVLALADDVRSAAPAGAIAGHLTKELESASFRVTAVGTSEFVPAGEAVVRAMQADVDLVVGVVSTKSCPVLLVPPEVAEPRQPSGPIEGPALAALVKQMAEASRYRYSAAVAAGLRGTARWCSRPASEIEAYVLAESAHPIIIVRLRSGEADAVLKAVPTALRAATRVDQP